MGDSRFSADDWSGYTKSTSTKTAREIFSGSSMDSSLDPKTISVRESVDSEANPNSTPVIVAVDVTGSMGMLAENIVRKGLGVIMKEIYDRLPISDPHIMLMAVGDAVFDSAPLQVTQFEADIVLAKQLEKFYIERGGGSNDGESYNLAWYFAAMKTKTDSMIKRHKKGYLFTIGDEPPLNNLTKSQIKTIFGDDVQSDLTTKQLLNMASESWEVFHLIVKPGSIRDAEARWSDLLGQRSIKVSDHEKLAEVIVSTMQVIEGKDAKEVIDSWSGDTSLVVANAVGALTKSAGTSGGVQRL